MRQLGPTKRCAAVMESGALTGCLASNSKQEPSVQGSSVLSASSSLPAGMGRPRSGDSPRSKATASSAKCSHSAVLANCSSRGRTCSFKMLCVPGLKLSYHTAGGTAVVTLVNDERCCRHQLYRALINTSLSSSLNSS